MIYVGVASNATPFYFLEEYFTMQKQMMPKGYEPKEVESKWYQFWEEEGLFASIECIVVDDHGQDLPRPGV